jgi:hypothetical protein
VLDHLQPDEAADQDARSKTDDEDGGETQPETEPVEIGFRIVEVTHVRSTSDRAVGVCSTGGIAAGAG